MSFTGKFKLTKSENFDKYLESIGVSLEIRNLAEADIPVIEITQDGDTFNIKTFYSFKTTEYHFKLGEEFDETSADGRDCKSVVTKEENTLVHLQTCRGQTLKILKEFSDDEMKMILEGPGNVISTRIFGRI